MDALASIQVRLREINDAIRKFEAALRANPSSDSTLLSLRSLENLRSKLELRYNELSAEVGLDIFSYRLFRSSRRETLMPVLSACIAFQKLYSLVYAALKADRPIESTGISAAVAGDTELGLAYSFRGSIGFALTLPNETMVAEPRVEQAMSLLLTMSQTTQHEDLTAFLKRLGRGPMKALYEWSSAHANEELSAEIHWKRRDVVKGHITVTDVHLGALAELLKKRLPPEEEIIEIPLCTLTAINTTRRTFSLTIPLLPPVNGELHAAVDRDHTVEVPADYSAKIKRITERSLGADDDKVTYLLLRLKRLSNG